MLIKEKLLKPSLKFLDRSDEQKKQSEQTQYQIHKEHFESLQKQHQKHKSDKNISEALKTTTELQKLLKEKILPLNEKSRETLKKLSEEKMERLEDSVSNVKKETNKIDQKMEKAKNDLTELEKISPIPKDEENNLKKECKSTEAKIEEERKILKEKWGKIFNASKKFIAAIKKLSKLKIELSKKEEKLESTQFKTLRWEEAKTDRKEQLGKFIEEMSGAKTYLGKLEALLARGVGCLLFTQKKQLDAVQRREGSLKRDYDTSFEFLRSSLETDVGNKEKQLLRLEKMEKSLEMQLEEAVELMDEESVESLKEQINNLPQKKERLSNKIKNLKEEIGAMVEKSGKNKNLTKNK
ncbi:hypothetical protein MHBO_003705, partial [Bonamia ostreae]